MGDSCIDSDFLADVVDLSNDDEGSLGGTFERKDAVADGGFDILRGDDGGVKLVAKGEVEVAGGGEIDATVEVPEEGPRLILDGDVTDSVFEDDALSVAVEAEIGGIFWSGRFFRNEPRFPFDGGVARGAPAEASEVDEAAFPNRAVA